jgi:threonylcarbamoyladenosine tRNA methylthiotransferase MtaB
MPADIIPIGTPGNFHSHQLGITFDIMSQGKKYLLSTLGCKVNQYESQQIRELLESLGLKPALNDDPADVAVINTCAVTTSALAKSRQAIRRLTRKGCQAVFVVGCGASAQGDHLRGIEGVTAVIGHDADIMAELRSRLLRRLNGAGHDSQTDQTTAGADGLPQVERNDDVWMSPDAPPQNKRCAEDRPADAPAKIISVSLPIVKDSTTLVERIHRFEGHQRAFLKVQDGCDAFCTYCIVPRLRPSLRSKPVEIAVEEAATLVQAGYKEIIVTGIYLGAYGRETAVRKRFTSGVSPLARLVEALAAVPGLERLRLSSLEPGDVDDSLLETLASRARDNCVSHLHLPLQSGSPAILRRMNRQYTRDNFLGMIERVKAALDQPAVTTDIIVGFPGETERDFLDTLDVARGCEFCKIHAFPFSPRPNTAAARWTRDFLPGTVVRERMARLAAVERKSSLAFRRRFLGRVERVIVEKAGEMRVAGRARHPVTLSDKPPAVSVDGDSQPCDDQLIGLCSGRTDRYFPVHFEAASLQSGDVVFVRIEEATPARTLGVLARRRDAK